MAPGFPKPSKKPAARAASAILIDFDSALTQGISNEETAERYQWGPKAHRHFQAALDAYRLAARLGQQQSEDTFDAVFNGARVLATLAEQFTSGREECVEQLKAAVGVYKEAVVTVAGKAGRESDLVDAKYNLGQTLVTIGDALDEGAGSPNTSGKAEEAWEAAVVELSDVLEMQRQLYLAQDPLPSSSSTSSLEDAAAPDSSTAPDPDQGAGEARELYILTPSVILDTALALIEALSNLVRSQPVYLERLQLVLDYGHSLVDIMPLDQRPSDIDIAGLNMDLLVLESELDGGSTPADQLFLRLTELCSSIEHLRNANCPSGTEPFHNQSSLASAVFTAASLAAAVAHRLSDPSSHRLAEKLTEMALVFHQTLQQRLESRLKPIKDIRPHQIPPLLTRNLVAQSEMTLLLSYLQPASALPSRTQAFTLAVASFNASFPASILSAAADQSPRIGLSPRPPGDVRTDWPCVAARLDALRVMARTRSVMRIQGEELAKMVKRLGGEARDVERWKEECEDDGVQVVSGIGGDLWDSIIGFL